MPAANQTTGREITPAAELALSCVAEALGKIRFGDIRLTIHEGRLVQVDVTEKTRFSNNGS